MASLNPLQPLGNPGSMFEDLLRDAMSPLLAMSGPDVTSMRIVPRIDVCETEEGYEIEAELPGVDLDQVRVTLTGDTLTIQGEKIREQRESGMFHVMERSFGTFTRTLSFPTMVDGDAIEATGHDGVLRIHVPKAAETKPRRIEVKPGSQQKKQVAVGAGAQQQGAAGQQGRGKSSTAGQEGGGEDPLS
jgi:HSP20 family protein